MIWNSVYIMTVIDLIIILITIFALWNVYKNRELLKLLNLFSGMTLTWCGLVIIASFYFADIIIMHLLPIFIPDNEAVAVMRTLQLGFNWIVSTIGVSLIVLSIVYFNKVLFPKIMSMEDELKKLASTDSLTQAYNRTKFDEILSKETERARRYDHSLSVVLFDIDHFKKVNDTYGHLAGDQVLKTIVDITRKNIREIDYLIRWGGEEFMIILPETGLDKAEELAERIRQIIEIHQFNEIGKVTVSFGVAQLRKSDSEKTFIKRSDDALYKAKINGRNRVEVMT